MVLQSQLGQFARINRVVAEAATADGQEFEQLIVAVEQGRVQHFHALARKLQV